MLVKLKNDLKIVQNDTKSIKVQKMQKKSKIKTIYLDSFMTKSHFVLEKLCPVNLKKKKTKFYTILALIITITL
jgi:hypothetical protein